MRLLGLTSASSEFVLSEMWGKFERNKMLMKVKYFIKSYFKEFQSDDSCQMKANGIDFDAIKLIQGEIYYD